MTKSEAPRPRTALRAIIFALITLSSLLIVVSMARAAQAPVGLGTAGSFAVLAGSAVTNTGPSVVNGNLGVSPASAVTGFPPGTVNGVIHEGNAVAAQAQSDLTTAYNDAAGRACDSELTGQNLGGMTLTAGAYCFSTSAQLTGTLTLDAQGDPGAVFIFQIGSTLTTASNAGVNLINGAQACNIFWQIGSSATLGTNTSFKGNILALTSITLNTGATITNGRALARNGAATLDSNTITRATCAPVSTPTPTPTTHTDTDTDTDDSYAYTLGDFVADSHGESHGYSHTDAHDLHTHADTNAGNPDADTDSDAHADLHAHVDPGSEPGPDVAGSRPREGTVRRRTVIRKSGLDRRVGCGAQGGRHRGR